MDFPPPLRATTGLDAIPGLRAASVVAAICEMIVKSTLTLVDIVLLLQRYAQSVGDTLPPIGLVRHLCFFLMIANVGQHMFLKNYLMSHRQKPSSEMMFGLVPVQ